jgi:hypothetical protein
MSPSRWALSGLLVLHLTAVALGAIPAPSMLRPVAPPRYPTDDFLAASLTPVMDRAAAHAYAASSALWRAFAPLPQLSRVYLRSMGLGQQWTMFWDPPKQDEYIRLRYYVARADETQAGWTATELVFPEGRDDELRLVSAFWTKPRDKSVFAALDGFLRRREAMGLDHETDPAGLPNNLQPVCRYFARRFQSRYLTDGERVIRTEVWFGGAPVPPRGVVEDPAILADRLDALNRYYAGPIENQISVGTDVPINTGEREADIVWFLEYAYSNQ